MSRAKTEPGTPNGIRAGTASIPAPIAEPVSLRDHPLIRHGAKVALAIIIAGLLSGAAWVVFDARDALRDHGRAVGQIKPIRDRVKSLERSEIEIRGDMKWIQRSLIRIERAAGSRPEPLPRDEP